MEVAVLDKTGQETGRKVELKDEVFAVEPNEHVVYLAVKQYLANQRRGTHKAKERGEIAGSTRKVKKQKGTGTARMGSIKSPVLRGGGRIFGPRPRNYGFKLNKKVKQLAQLSALSLKAKENNVIVLEDLKFEQPKTRDFISLVDNLKIADKKSLFVLADENKNVYLSSRNLKSAKVVTFDALNTYDILNTKSLVLSESAVAKINEKFQ